MSFLSSYSPNYFSIDDILATQERTPCKFLTDVPKLGRLNPASEDDNLAVGTVLELPMWLVIKLNSKRIVAPEVPRIYTEPYREILKADPLALKLPKFNLYFYELGGYAKLLDSRGDVADILTFTFISRFKKLMDLADNAGPDPKNLESLDVLEKGLFNVGRRTRQKLNLWLYQSGIQLEASNLVSNHRKRKRVDLEKI